MIWKKDGLDLVAKCGYLSAYVREEEGGWEWWLDGVMLYGLAKTRGKAIVAAEKAMKKIVDKMVKDLNAGQVFLRKNTLTEREQLRAVGLSKYAC